VTSVEQQQRRRRRPRARGVAALEFALSLTFLVPLMGAAVDYGYYFYVGSNAEEAARAGLRQAILKFRADYPGSNCTIAPGVGQKAIVAAFGQNVNTGEAFLVMDQPPLSMKSNTQVQLTCDALPNPPAVDPTWHIMVRVDFSPAMGIVAPFMPAGGPGKVRYTARLNGN
jgi:hypothetical protein